MEEFEEELKSIAERELFSGAFEEAEKLSRKRILADQEWTTPKYYHVHELVTAFAVGVLRADPWHKYYKIPPNFENVVNWIAFCIQREWTDTEVPQVSLIEMEAKYRKWAFENPNFVAWNDSEDSTIVGITTRYSPVPEKRDFIDLDALLRNATIFLRDETRKNEAFDKKFEEDWKENHKGDENEI